MELEKKAALHEHCQAHIQLKIADLRKEIAAQKEGLEGSSSAGDKHNTEGAMHHLEEEKKMHQLDNFLQQAKILSQINPSKKCNKVELGALVITNKGTFYFAAPMGKIIFEKHEIMVLSLASPLGRILSKMSKDESVCFNNDLWVIQEVV